MCLPAPAPDGSSGRGTHGEWALMEAVADLLLRNGVLRSLFQMFASFCGLCTAASLVNGNPVDVGYRVLNFLGIPNEWVLSIGSYLVDNTGAETNRRWLIGLAVLVLGFALSGNLWAGQALDPTTSLCRFRRPPGGCVWPVRRSAVPGGRSEWPCRRQHGGSSTDSEPVCEISGGGTWFNLDQRCSSCSWCHSWRWCSTVDPPRTRRS